MQLASFCVCCPGTFRSKTVFTFVRLSSVASAESTTTAKSLPGHCKYAYPPTIDICGQSFPTDSWTNVTSKVSELSQRKLLRTPRNPLFLLKQKIVDFFHQTYRNRGNRSPLFAVHDNLSPVVTVGQNFDSLLVPSGHVCRDRSDSYYINKDHLLRSHTSAHQADLIKSGLDAFLVFGDAYRRDAIDRNHYPVFHQMEGVRLFTDFELFGAGNDLKLFRPVPDGLSPEAAQRFPDCQERHSMDAAILLERNLKQTLESLVMALFGDVRDLRWTASYFPFTHPSWELEILYRDEWLELLGCGIVEQQLLDNSGPGGTKAGWAFGMGLDRVAMKLYQIPDIRLFWSLDSGIRCQFDTEDHRMDIVFRPVSQFKQNVMDVSFWLPPTSAEMTSMPDTHAQSGDQLLSTSPPVDEPSRYHPNDFYDVVRQVAGDVVEQVYIIDDFLHPTTGRRSHCYRIVYRHMERRLSNNEANGLNRLIRNEMVARYGVELRGET